MEFLTWETPQILNFYTLGNSSHPPPHKKVRTISINENQSINNWLIIDCNQYNQ